MRTDTHDLATHNDGDLLSVLGTQFQFTAEELRGWNRTSREAHVPHRGAVYEDCLGRRSRVREILRFHIEPSTVTTLR